MSTVSDLLESLRDGEISAADLAVLCRTLESPDGRRQARHHLLTELDLYSVFAFDETVVHPLEPTFIQPDKPEEKSHRPLPLSRRTVAVAAAIVAGFFIVFGLHRVPGPSTEEVATLSFSSGSATAGGDGAVISLSPSQRSTVLPAGATIGLSALFSTGDAARHTVVLEQGSALFTVPSDGIRPPMTVRTRQGEVTVAAGVFSLGASGPGESLEVEQGRVLVSGDEDAAPRMVGPGEHLETGTMRPPFDAPDSGLEESVRRGLVGYWTIDDIAGVLVPDASGHRNDLRLLDPEIAPGISGGALRCGGFPDPQIAGCRYAIGGSDFSVALWLKIADDRPDKGIQTIFANSPHGVYEQGYRLYVHRIDWDGQLSETVEDWAVHLESGDGAVSLRASSMPAALTPERWHHVAVVIRPGDGKVRFYVDGQDVTLYGDILRNVRGGTDLTFAAMNGEFTNRLHGLMDEIRLYGRALASPEISWITGLHSPAARTHETQ